MAVEEEAVLRSFFEAFSKCCFASLAQSLFLELAWSVRPLVWMMIRRLWLLGWVVPSRPVPRSATVLAVRR